ncbi:MAG: M43 family zinc metalloprotease [Bacteroidota bacterium]
MTRLLRCSLFSTNKAFKSTFLKPALTIITIIFSAGLALAQKPAHTGKMKPEMKRCGTMEGIAEMMKTDPELRARVEQNERDYQNWLHNPNRNNIANRPASPTALPGPVTIPVVVHIVLPNPWIVTDESVDFFINRLNEDFAGINADSTNCGSFCNLRGHSLIRFTRAKRDPQGNFTTGIIRKIGSTAITGGNQPIKNSNTTTGGSTGWNVGQYYNLYVGDGGSASLLGISPGIGPGSSVVGSGGQDGVCVDYRCFADQCFSYPEYQLSRTPVHEIGHNFGLYHIFQGGCSGGDFMQLTSGCSLPNNLLGGIDDTPGQDANTRGCPSGNPTNGCNPSVPKMFQNYMDYTGDACYSMFTNAQVRRMEWVLENCRSGYLTTLGGQPPTLPSLDAMINSVVSPGGAEASATCDDIGVAYPVQTCPGSFVPKLRITNAGTTTLTAITVTTSINNLFAEVETLAVNMAPGKSQVVTLHVQTAVAGPNALKFTLSAPNGGADANPLNDELIVNFNTGVPLVLPFTENFASTIFPPDNGSALINPDAATTWERDNAGRPGPGSLKMDFFNYDGEGERDIFSLPPVLLDQYDSIQLSFYVAYQQFEDQQTPPINDSLIIVYTTDCGATWQRTDFAKGGSTLKTVANSENPFTPNNSSQWRKESIMMKDFCVRGLKNIRIGFQSYNNFGNNLYVDSISLTGFGGTGVNTILTSIEEPPSASCNGQFSPKVQFRNETPDTLKTLTIKYVIDNSADTIAYNWTGNLAKCDYATAILPPGSVNLGAHIIDVFTANPNGSADVIPSNDKLSKNFVVITNQDMPIAEAFEGNIFPPDNWGVINVNGGTTWEKNILTAPHNGAMVIKNFNSSNSYNALDYFISPRVNSVAEADSILVDFEMAYQHGANLASSTNQPLDTLEVLVTNDCGNSFTSVWKKWGVALQTTLTPDFIWDTAFTPKAEEWRKEKINLTSLAGSSDFQLYWALKGNKQNRLWIDNINIYSLKLPERQKKQGYLIYPNPFNGSFLINHTATPLDLKAIVIYNSGGQLVWSNEYNGNANKQVTVNLHNVANGVYVLKMIYTNKTVVERIVKAQ